MKQKVIFTKSKKAKSANLTFALFAYLFMLLYTLYENINTAFHNIPEPCDPN